MSGSSTFAQMPSVKAPSGLGGLIVTASMGSQSVKKNDGTGRPATTTGHLEASYKEGFKSRYRQADQWV